MCVCFSPIMPWLMFTNPRGQGETAGLDRGSEWMERKKEHKESLETSRELQRSTQALAVVQPQHTSCSQTLRRLFLWKDWYSWYSFAPVGIVWSVCQVEAPLQPSLLLLDPGCRFLQVCLLWLVLGGCVHALKCCLRRGQSWDNLSLRLQQEGLAENRTNLHAWPPQSRSPGLHAPLALAVVDCLLVLVLQEPLPDPSVAHIQALLSRLQSVSHTLEKADIESEVTLMELDQHSGLRNKVMLIHSFLQERMQLLGRLVRVQGDFEASVKDMLGSLDGLWTQLEELHAGVTLTKEGGRGHRDLALAQRDVKTLIAVLSHHRSRHQCCQAHLTDSTQLLQELTWSHAHMSSSGTSSSELVWPEMLLQSNIEQFNKVQESFLSLEHQTSTFQAHLEGLRNGNQDRHDHRASSCPASPKTLQHPHSGHSGDVSKQHQNSIPPFSSVNADTDHQLSLCERSALHFSSTIGRLRKSGRKK